MLARILLPINISFQHYFLLYFVFKFAISSCKYLSLVCLCKYVQILVMSEEISPEELDFLLRFPVKPHVASPVDFLSDHSWGGICSLSGRLEFTNLDREIEGAPLKWKKVVEMECPEKEKLPQVRVLLHFKNLHVFSGSSIRWFYVTSISSIII